MLEEILEKTKTLPTDDQLKQICDQIQKEEEEKFRDYLGEMPKGPNMFLAIWVPGITGKELCYVCLEREFPGKYLVTLWSKLSEKSIIKKKSLIRTKVWEVKESAPKKILEEYAKILKFMRGK
jgi:hypothetical protein